MCYCIVLRIANIECISTVLNKIFSFCCIYYRKIKLQGGYIKRFFLISKDFIKFFFLHFDMLFTCKICEQSIVCLSQPKVHNLPKFLSWAMGYEEMGASQGRQSLVNNVKNYCSQQNRAVLAFPEGAMTNGALGLLKFR